jgi:FlaA1/EpsC-like NDP-sugar epimerase
MSFSMVRAFFKTFGFRFWLVGGAYLLLLSASFYLAFELRFDFALELEEQQERLRLLGYVLAIKFLCLVLMRQMGSVMRYFSMPDLARLVAAMALSSAFLIVPRFFEHANLTMSRGVLLIDFLLSVIGLCAIRLAFRIYQERITAARGGKQHKYQAVVIVGAGDTGASLTKELLARPARGLRPIALLDDDATMHGRLIHGVPVEGSPAQFASISALKQVTHAIIAMPTAPVKRRAEIALQLARLGVKVETVPAIEDLASGKARVSRIRPIEIQDLLGRPAVDLDNASIRNLVEHKVVVVTGAGGSIGSELCRQIAALNPRRLLLVEQSEPALFLIEQQLIKLGFSGCILPCVADILDANRIHALFATHSPNIVFHAAAHKHVYLMERQPAEAIKNNAMGTRQLAEIAIAHGTETFVLVSTDKAINPTNVMGASKRLAEIHLQAVYAEQFKAASTPVYSHGVVQGSAETSTKIDASTERARSGNRAEAAGPYLLNSTASPFKRKPTKIMAVRFGNVLGSSGSVLPIFKQQIEEGGPVTVTHPYVTRYFMTIPEAVGLILQSGGMGQGGEIFVLDMGQPVKIVDLAKSMIELSGYKVGEDIDIRFTGLKAGEKLFEELQHHSELHTPTAHPRIMQFSSTNDFSKVSQLARTDFEPFVDELSANDLKKNLKILIPEYEPCLD